MKRVELNMVEIAEATTTIIAGDVDIVCEYPSEVGTTLINPAMSSGFLKDLEGRSFRILKINIPAGLKAGPLPTTVEDGVTITAEEIMPMMKGEEFETDFTVKMDGNKLMSISPYRALADKIDKEIIGHE